MKILTIFTGGTIGSAEHGGFITPDPSMKYRLISDYKKKFSHDIEFITLEPYTILSENLSGQTLTKLVECVCDNIDTDVEGIIVAHGTDTLQYSAAATAFCLGHETKPVVFVSANYPLDNKLTNGYINFEAAVEFIRSGLGRGVFVSYSNNLKTVGIHPASCLLRHGELSHEIFSIDGPDFSYTFGSPIKCEKIYPKNASIPCGKVQFCDDPGILQIIAAPFENYKYDLEAIKAVVFVPYHSGTLNTESSALKAFCQKALNNSIPLFMIGDAKGKEYASMKCYEELGITTLLRITSIATVIKIWIAISKHEDIMRFVSTRILDECVNI